MAWSLSACLLLIDSFIAYLLTLILSLFSCCNLTHSSFTARLTAEFYRLYNLILSTYWSILLWYSTTIFWSFCSRSWRVNSLLELLLLCLSNDFSFFRSIILQKSLAILSLTPDFVFSRVIKLSKLCKCFVWICARCNSLWNPN